MNIESYLNAKRIGQRHAGQRASEKTLETYHESLSRAERALNKPILEATEQDVDNMLAYFENKGLSASTINLTLAACNGYFKWAVGNKLVAENPFEGIVGVKGESREPKILTEEEAKSIIAATQMHKYKLLFSLLFYGCLRVNEVLTLRTRDVHEDGIVVRGKGDKDRFVNLPKHVLKKLHAFIGNYEREYVFERWNSEPIRYEAVFNVFKHAVEKAGMRRSDVRIHNMRHSGSTILYQRTKDIVATNKHIGHADIRTTMKYVKMGKEDVTNAYRKAFG